MGNRKVRTGRVVSAKMDKTVVVAVEWRSTHPLYGKSVRRITKFYAHDEANQCQTGDVVRIEETRPLSRLKRWRVTQILNRATLPETAPEEIDATETPEPVAEPTPTDPEESA